VSPQGPRILEWHRAAAGARMKRVLVLGPAVLTLGGLVIAASFLTRAPRALRADATLLGLALVAGAALFTMIGMQRILRDDRYLAVRTDGLFLQASGKETLIPWDRLERATWDPARRALVLERAEQPPIVVLGEFADIGGPELAGRIHAARRKAAMNLLRG